MTRRYIALATMLVVVLLACTIPEIPVIDSGDYYRVAEIIRGMEGDSAAEHFLATHDSGKVVLVEDTIRLTGVLNDRPNTVYAALGNIMAYALRTGNSAIIGAMQAWIVPIYPITRTNMTTPVRTAGGRGVNVYVTVQSTYTHLCSPGNEVSYIKAWLLSEGKDIAHQLGDDQWLNNGDILQLNWTINVGGTYSAIQRAQLAKGISPEAGFGGTIYPIAVGKFTHSAAWETRPVKQFTGGDGNVETLLAEFEYTHYGVDRNLLRFDVLNSNMDIIASATGLNIPMTADDIINAFHYVQFLGE